MKTGSDFPNPYDPPLDDQAEFEIPGAREADAEAEATRAKDQQELADRQPIEKPQSAFNVPEGPLFGMFR